MNVGDESNYKISDAFASYLLTNSPKKTLSSQKIDKRVLAIAQYFFEIEHRLSLMSEVGLNHLEIFETWAMEPHICGNIQKDFWGQNSIVRHSKTIKTIFRKAFLTGRIQRDPSALWKLSSGDPAHRRRPMTEEEFEKLLSIAPDWFRPVLRILGATGARPSSIARLKWSDVDLAAGTLYFTSRKGGRNREKRNPFPIFDELRQILTQIPQSGEFVFQKDGLPISGPLISTTGHRLIKSADMHGVVLYGLRHKFATDLLRAGTSTELARRLMGHANESMLKQYSSELGIEALNMAVTSIRGKK